MLTETETNSIKEAIARDLSAHVRDINDMGEKLPAFKALPNALNKMFDKINDASTKAIAEFEQIGDHGQAVIGKYVGVGKQAKSVFDDHEKALDEAMNEGVTNGGPLATTKEP